MCRTSWNKRPHRRRSRTGTETKQEDTSLDPILTDLHHEIKTTKTSYNRHYTTNTKNTKKPKTIPYKTRLKLIARLTLIKKEDESSFGKTPTLERQQKTAGYVFKKRKSFKRERGLVQFLYFTGSFIHNFFFL